MEQSRQSLEVQVLERAAKDPQLREQLKQDQRGTGLWGAGAPGQ